MDNVRTRNGVEFPIVDKSVIDYMDVSPNQIVSISAALIPFLENDDANRALMGSNMMRQSVPLLQPEIPIVGTGMEKTLAVDSRSAIVSKHDGVVSSIDSTHIQIETSGEPEELELNKEKNSTLII